MLSVGHASALLYGLLHLCGVKAATRLDSSRDGLAVSIADLQSFRQAGSRCTGHPENGWTTGVETTTGPLGQGLATSVGMVIAQAWLAATYNRPGFTLFAHRVIALAGDGDMMEGVSAEAASLAGHLKLNRLCWIYDCNHISIEGPTALTFTEDVGARFTAYGWQVLRVADANDIVATTQALKTFDGTQYRPTLIIVDSHIGWGAPHKQDTAAAHGEPLGALEARAASGQVLNAIAAQVPWLLGGAADLAPSTKTKLGFEFAGTFEPPSPAGRNFHFGIREHAMCAAASGTALSGLRPFAASFFVFTDYARGAYVLADADDGRPDLLLLVSGSEVALCIAAYEQLKLEAVKARVISMPSWDLFELQDAPYQEQVLPEAVKARVSVEAASALGEDRYVGRHGEIIAMHSFGLSAPGKAVQAHFGFDVTHVLDAARRQLERHGARAAY